MTITSWSHQLLKKIKSQFILFNYIIILYVIEIYINYTIIL